MSQGSILPDNSAPAAEPITIQTLAARLWHGMWAVWGCAAIGLVLGLVFLAVVPPAYVANMKVAQPVQSAGQFSQSGGQFASAFGLGGLLSGSDSSAFRLYQDIITSETVAQRVEDHHHVMREIFAARWDKAENRWRPRSGLTASLSDMLNGLLGRPPSPSAPHIQDLAEFIDSHIRIDTPSLNSPVRVVSLSYSDPQMAANLLLWVHQETDAVVRGSSLQRTEGTIDYLRHQLPEVTNSDEHFALTQLLVAQEQNLMLLNTHVDYAATIVDPPIRPVRPTPSLGFTLLLSLVAGFAVGCLLTLALPRAVIDKIGSEGRVHLARPVAYWQKSFRGS
jgi:Chain length determinant protein